MRPVDARAALDSSEQASFTHACTEPAPPPPDSPNGRRTECWRRRLPTHGGAEGSAQPAADLSSVHAISGSPAPIQHNIDAEPLFRGGRKPAIMWMLARWPI
jgi:hypothetical protein